MMQRTLFRANKDRYCKATIVLRDNKGKLELSVTGEEGRVLSPAKASKEAYTRMRDFFLENPSERRSINERFGWGPKTATQVARKVLEIDGEYTGLDAHESDGKVYAADGFGCIHDTLQEWFPEIAPLIPYHLNSMHSGCIHQRAMGWGTCPGHWNADSKPCEGFEFKGVSPASFTTRRCTKDKIGQKCPECGYSFGSAWLHEDLPDSILNLAKTIGDAEA